MSLPASFEAVQRKDAPSAAIRQQSRDTSLQGQTVEDWTDVAFRPDLYQAPILRSRADRQQPAAGPGTAQTRQTQPLPGRDEIMATVTARFPWLARLSNQEEIARVVGERARLEFEKRRLQAELSALPSPRATLVSHEIGERERAREPLERQLQAIVARQGSLPSEVAVDAAEALAAGFTEGEDAADTAGRRALADFVAARPAMLRTWYSGIGEYPSVGLYIDGAWVKAGASGISLETFFRESASLHAMQLVYLTAAVAGGKDKLREITLANPWLARANLRAMMREGDARRVAEMRLDEDELATLELQMDRQKVARDMSDAAIAAMVPLAITASLFVADGPVDLLLAVVPVSKLGKAYGAGKKAIKLHGNSKKARRLREIFAGALDGESEAFLRLASKMSRGDIRALKKIYQHVGSPDVIRALMRQRLQGHADLRWIARKLDDGELDGTFVRRFTLYEANPSWSVLTAVIDNKFVADGKRKWLAKQVKGLMGEEAAAKLIKSNAFARRELKGRRGKRLGVEQGADYSDAEQGVKGSLDIVATSDGADVMFGEVKNWSASTWADAGSRAKCLAQLKRHNAGIERVLEREHLDSSDITSKILFVSARGFKDGMMEEARRKFINAVANLGWRIEYIDSDKIRSFDNIIDDLR